LELEGHLTEKKNKKTKTLSFVSWKKRKPFFLAFPMERRQRARNKQTKTQWIMD